jgi:hypothetical protein
MVEIEFDEYINVEDISSQLLISPPLKDKPQERVRGKKLRLTWSDTLQSNTTYQFNFGKSVVDLNESNPNTDLRYVFSTGSYVDSLAIYGKVLNSLDNEPVPLASVMIYDGVEDSLPKTSMPSYFALTNELGEFRLDYLPEGDFKLFVLTDGNGNYMYDGPPEEIGFLDRRVNSMPIDSQRPMVIPLFMESDTNQYIKSSTGKDYGYYETIFNIPTIKPSIRFIDPETDVELVKISILNERRDTLKNWVTFPERREFDEVQVIIQDDSLLQDTAFWYIETDPKYAEKAKLTVSANTNMNKLDIGGNFELILSQPIDEADTSLIWMIEDSTRVYPSRIEKDKVFRSMRIFYPFIKEKQYLVSALPGAFKDIFGNYSDSTGFAFSLQEAEFYGFFTVNVTLENPLNKGAAILQLGDKAGSVKQEVRFTQSETISFGRMPPGAYTLKIVFDENDNGKWDTGNYLEKAQPEKVSIYPEEINIRSNWDLDIDWSPLSAYPD